MGTYQIYDFRAIDQPLSPDEIETIRGYSSRVEPSATKATFVYHYSDFQYDEVEVLNDHFDIMLYVANWGSRRLLIKIPAGIVSLEAIKAFDIDVGYGFTNEIRITKKGDNLIIDLNSNQEEGEWIEAEGILDGLIPIRDQLMEGDFRVLYLAWLSFVLGAEEIEEEILTPPVPANLSNLTYPLNKFVEFWDIDDRIVQFAATSSQEESPIHDEQLLEQIPSLSDSEKNHFLSMLISNKTKAQQSLRKKLKDQLTKGSSEKKDIGKRSTLEQLLQAWKANY